MTATDDLRAWVGAPAGDDSILGACVAEATALVDQRIGSTPVLPEPEPPAEGEEPTVPTTPSAGVPAAIRSRAILEVGAELYHRKNAPNGVAQFAALDGAPVRVARDPMVAANAILSPFLPGGFA